MTQEQQLLRHLRSMRGRIRTLWTLHGVGRLLVIVPPAILLAVLLDYLLHFPGPLRGLLLVGLAAVAVVTVLHHLWRPLRVRIGVEDVALELEGRFPDLNDRLATTVNFVTHEPERGESRVLRQAVVDETMRSVSGMRFDRALRPWPLVSIFVAGLLVLAAVGGLGLRYSHAAGVGLERLFNPLTAREWPKETRLILTEKPLVVHPIGEDYQARVQVDPAGKTPERVIIYFREIGAEGRPDHQVLDRLQVADAAVFGCTFKQVRKSFEYYIEGGDDRVPAGGSILVDARPRPRVESVQLTLRLPEYVKGAETQVISGQGSTHALRGSTVTMEVVTNKGIAVDKQGRPRAELRLENRPPLALEFVPPSSPAGDAAAAADEERLLEAKRAAHACLRTTFELEETARFNFNLVCVDGFQGEQGEDCYLVADQDDAPRVQFVQPTQAMLDVTPRTVVPVEVLAKDDYGLTKTALGWQRGGSQQKATVGLSLIHIDDGTPERPLALYAGRRWDLREIEPPLREGEELIYRAAAVDNYDWRGEGPNVAESQEYRLRVVSQKTMEAKLKQDLAALGLRVDDLVKKQEAVQSQTKETRADKPPAEPLSAKGRDQALQEESSERQIKKEAEGLQQAFEGLLEQFRLHRLPEEEAFKHASEMRDALEEVQKDPMPKAADELRDARDAAAAPQKQSQSLSGAIDQMQRAIDRLRTPLGQLQKFTEADQLAERFKRLLRDQEMLTEKTRQHAAQTLGKAQSELSADEKQSQQALERRENEMARETKDAVQEMKDSSEKLQESQPAVAQAMQEALKEAENRNPAGKMQNAADQIAQNQYGNAKSNQEASQEDLKAIIEKLQDRRLAELQEQQKRLEELKRELEEIRKREEGHLQENKEAQAAQPNAPSPQQQSPKQGQTAQATQNLAQKMDAAQAGQAGQTTQGASQNMQQASGQLSQSQSQQAQQEQEEALKKLDQAKQELQDEMDRNQEEQAQEKLEKLKDRLARMRDEEFQVRKATGEIETKKQVAQLERSDETKLVFNQDKQKELLNESGDVLREMADEGVKVYHFAMTIVADRMAESHDRLVKTLTDRVTQTAQEKAVRILDQLISSLEEEMSKKKKKGGGGGGQGNRGGKPALVPTMAELKMLRLMQSEINEATAKTDEQVKPAEQPAPEVQAEAERLGRDQQKVKQLMESLVDPNAPGPGGQVQ